MKALRRIMIGSVFSGSWQAIEVVIALPRNMSQICDRCYMIGRRDTKREAGCARDDAAGGGEKP
jgi:hypothetical protein